MPRLSDRIENVLNESRMLLLGGQVLLGFTYRICFEPSFELLPRTAQYAEVIALATMTVGLSWLLLPAAFHRIAEHGWQTQRIHEFTNNVLDWALLPFCLGIGLSFYPVCLALRTPHPALISIATGCLALFAWYGASVLGRERSGNARNRSRRALQKEERDQPDDLPERIKKVLIECRMALPGAQAFLGFQFAIVFTEIFGKMSRGLQWVHFASLVATTVAIVLLITPAAYHRLAEAGEDTEHFHQVASYLLVAALVFLAPGMAGDLYVVLMKVTASMQIGVVIGGGFLFACYALWFGFSYVMRRPNELRKREHQS
jgi:hypothetical protein